MLTSHCQHCGGPKAANEYENIYCGTCSRLREDTRKTITAENEARNNENARIIEENRAKLESGELHPSALGLKPLIDMSAALRDTMLTRAHTTNGTHSDPRAIFNPGLVPASMENLGMGARIPPTAMVARALAPMVPPEGSGL